MRPWKDVLQQVGGGQKPSPLVPVLLGSLAAVSVSALVMLGAPETSPSESQPMWLPAGLGEERELPSRGNCVEP